MSSPSIAYRVRTLWLMIDPLYEREYENLGLRGGLGLDSRLLYITTDQALLGERAGPRGLIIVHAHCF
jgi:hypothetical protein